MKFLRLINLNLSLPRLTDNGNTDWLAWWQKDRRIVPSSAPRRRMISSPQGRATERIWDSAASGLRLPSSLPPHWGTYQMTLSLWVWAVISWRTRRDVTDGARGERAAEDEDTVRRRRTSCVTRSEQQHEEEPADTIAFIYCTLLPPLSLIGIAKGNFSRIKVYTLYVWKRRCIASIAVQSKFWSACKCLLNI